MPGAPRDLAHHDLTSYVEGGPWDLDPDRLAWRGDAAGRREAARARVPDLVRRRHLPPAARIGRTSAVLGRALGQWAALERGRGPEVARPALARRLRRAFQELGPTYIKLGQLIASGDGFLPDDLVREFKGLRDRVPGEPFERVRQVVEDELGRPLTDVFARFDGVPVAAASIAQVHLATLCSGEEVAVKVQRPDIGRLVVQDLAVMAWMAPILAARVDLLKILNLPALVELFAETVVEELDFRLEGDNMLEVAAVLDEGGQRAIVVPRPHPSLVTARVLVMERMDGLAFDDRQGMVEVGVDTAAVVRALLVSTLEGAMIHGVFHGDLHAGNLLVRQDGRVALLDYGITGRLEPARRQTFLRMLLAAIAGDHRAVLAGYQALGAIPAGTDLDAFLADFPVEGPGVDPLTASAEEVVAEMRRVTKALVAHGLRLPKELVLFLKNFMFIDGAIASLAPDLDILGELRHLSEYFITRHGARLAGELGYDPSGIRLDAPAVLGSVGLEPDLELLTHREIRERRRLVREKMAARRRS